MEIRRVEIPEMLAARDARAERQRSFLQTYGCPLVSFTMNIAGPVKLDAAILYAFREGVRRVAAACGEAVAAKTEIEEFTGCEAIWAVRMPAQALKARMIEIEDRDALGRLFDLDVIDVIGGKIPRGAENRRSCLLCGKPAHECARARTHSVDELFTRTHEIICAYAIGKAAERALLFEAECAPKPGLVDPEDPGAHRDMDIDSFRASAHALRPYFEECARIGAELRDVSDDTAFQAVRRAGIAAEAEMFRVTNGANTHKGVIFSIGLLSCAAGMAGDADASCRTQILNRAAALARVSLRDLDALSPATAMTGGEKQYLQYGLTGVRGQAAAGFPDAAEIALPVLERMKGNLNDAGLEALLRLIAQVSDSNLLRRGGPEGLAYAQTEARHLLEKGYTKDDLRRMNADFRVKNLSPGGSADLLAVSYFLLFLSDLYKGD